jgi:hypothetical protein
VNNYNPFLSIFNGLYDRFNKYNNILVSNGLINSPFHTIFNGMPISTIDLGLEHMPTLFDNTQNINSYKQISPLVSRFTGGFMTVNPINYSNINNASPFTIPFGSLFSNINKSILPF